MADKDKRRIQRLAHDRRYWKEQAELLRKELDHVIFERAQLEFFLRACRAEKLFPSERHFKFTDPNNTIFDIDLIECEDGHIRAIVLN